MNHSQKLVVSALATAGVAGLALAGQYAGGALFARLEHLPDSAVGIFTLRDYWRAYGHVKSVAKVLAACSIASGAIPVFPVVAGCAAAFATPRRALHGTARFARDGEIRDAGLFGPASAKPGIVIGRHKGQYLVFTGQQFVIIAAPTRGGKGVAVVIPNLLSFPDSVVVVDLKLENYAFTSGYRRRCGQAVYLWAPFATDGRTHRWNIFDAPAAMPYHARVAEVESIGRKVYPESRGDSADWNGAARDLFVGLALYLMETATPARRCTFGEILRQGSGMGTPVREHIEGLRRTPGLSLKCTLALDRFLANHDKVLTSILFTFNTKLTVFSVPSVDAATSACDFDVADVRRRRMSIYVGIPPNRLDSAELLMNLFFANLIDVNTAVLPEHDPALQYQCLLILDEFTAMGRIQIVNRANAFIAGYNLRLLTIIQAVSQLEPGELYGKEGARTLVVNHAAKIIFPPTDHEEAKQISDSLDYFTDTAVAKSRTRGRSPSTGESRSGHRRALMLPQELKEMPKHEQIIVGFGKPIRCKKAFYYDDAVFVDRLREVSPALAAIRGRLPNEAELKAAASSGELATWDDVPTHDPAQWLAEQENTIAACGPDGEKVFRARDLLAMDAMQVSEELAVRTHRALLRDLKEFQLDAQAVAIATWPGVSAGGVTDDTTKEAVHGQTE